MKRLLAIVLIINCGFIAKAETLKVGFASNDITPKAEDIKDGIKTQGWGRISNSLQKGDRLFVRAAAMRDKNDTLLVILTADTCKFHPADCYMLQEWFSKTFKVDRWHLIMNASHTHQAPSYCIPSKDPYANLYHDFFIKAVKTTISEAVKTATTPMRIKFARLQIASDMIYNKAYRKGIILAKHKKIIKEGTAEYYKRLSDEFNFVDTDFPVFAFFNAKTPEITGFLWSVAAHPTYIGSGGLIGPKGGMRISSHAPGAVARAIHRTYGENVFSMFAQGAAGDIKMEFPGLCERINYKYFRENKSGGFIWSKGENKGKLLTQKQYFEELNNYGMLFVDIIKQGFKKGAFREIKDLDFKIIGKEAKIPLTLNKPPARNKRGIKNYCYWKRPKGDVASYRKILSDNSAPDMEKYKAYDALYRIYDDKHAAYSIWFTKVMFNKHLQIVAMSNEICSEIGMNVKEYYKKHGVETVFWGYSPFGTPYYPSNLHKAEGTYQGSFMHTKPGFDFEKFALDEIINLKSNSKEASL